MFKQEYKVVIENDCTFWYKFDAKELHRTEGPAVIWPDGHEEYWVDGKRHRLGGPALILPGGTVEYWVDGELHRTEGPAVVWADGTVEYWVDGKNLSKEEFDALTNKSTCANKLVEIDGKKYKLVPAD